MSVREGEGDVAVGNMLVVNIQRTAAAAAVPRGTRAEPVLLVLCGVAVFVSSPRTHPPRLRRQIVPRRRVCFRTALCLLLLGRELFKCSWMCQWDTVHRCGKNSKQGSAHAQRARHTDTHTHTARAWSWCIFLGHHLAEWLDKFFSYLRRSVWSRSSDWMNEFVNVRLFPCWQLMYLKLASQNVMKQSQLRVSLWLACSRSSSGRMKRSESADWVHPVCCEDVDDQTLH